MRFDKLYLQNFRCYDELELEFDKNITVHPYFIMVSGFAS